MEVVQKKNEEEPAGLTPLIKHLQHGIGTEVGLRLLTLPGVGPAG